MSFQYKICTSDIALCSTPATVTIEVLPAGTNLAPIAGPAETFNATAGVPLTGDVLDAQDTDPNPGDTLHVELVTDVANGTLVLNPDGTFTYTADGTFVGTDTFTYVVEDQDGARSQEVTVTITVSAPPSDLPLPVGDALNTDGVSPFIFTFDDLLANDVGVGTNPFIVVNSAVSSGTLLVDPVNRRIGFTPLAGFTGDATFTYLACDDRGCSTTSATVTITVPSAGNLAPVAGPAETFDVFAGVPHIGSVLDAQDTDPNPGDTLHVELVTDVANGTLVLNPDGVFTYTADATFVGTDTFTYVVEDQDGARSQEVTVTMNVSPLAANQPPVANDETFTVQAGAIGTVGNLAANDTDSDTGDVVTFADAVAITNCGTPFSNRNPLDASGNVIFTVPAVVGTCTVTYQAKDSSGTLSDPGTATITVVPAANLAPVANNDPFETPHNEGFIGTVLDNDVDEQPSSLTAEITQMPTKGSATMDSSGRFTYTPTGDEVGTDTFKYRAQDIEGVFSMDATVTIDLTNSLPVAGGESPTTRFRTPVVIDVLSNDSDADSADTLTAIITRQPSSGSAVITASGSILYTPRNNFFGRDNFDYQAQDNHGRASFPVTTVFITVEAPVP